MTCSCLVHNKEHLVHLKRRQMPDPTRTKTLRDKFVREMNRRFKEVRLAVVESVVANDVFGLKDSHLARLAALPAGSFAFATDPQKVDGFMEWLQEEMNNDVLSVTVGPEQGIVGSARWTDTYIEASYKQGLKRADAELKKAGVETGRSGSRWIDAAFRAPFHADRVGLLYTRTFEDLKGITQAGANMMRRSLAESIAEGRGPRQIARILLKRLDGIGEDISLTDTLGRHIDALRRARMLARTEVVRAHHAATINSYEEAGVVGVKMKAEWSTAGDDRVCQACADLEGQIFTLDEVRSLIPLHPQCRCVALPAEVKVQAPKKGQAASRRLPGAASLPRAKKVPKPKGAARKKVKTKRFSAEEKEQIRERMVQPARAIRSGFEMVDVNTAELDKLWKMDIDMYIGEGGEGGIGDRYKMFQEYLKTGRDIETSEITISSDMPQRPVSFINGRHRFAVMRDRGMETIPVSMPKQSIEAASDIYPTLIK